MKKKTQEECIFEMTEKHNGYYKYDKVTYVNNVTPVIIVCPAHGEFQQTPKMHLNGQGCKLCGYEKVAKSKILSQQDALLKFRITHGDRYDYSQAEYKSMRDKIRIICKEHGPFMMKAAAHAHGQGCKVCGYEKVANGLMLDNDSWAAIRDEKLGSTGYGYDKVDYVDSRTKVIITCPKHGDFLQRPADHINQKHGCPRCANVDPSRGQIELAEYIKSLSSDIVIGDRSIIKPKELDIVVPSHKLAVEFNGILHHSEKFSKNPKYHLLAKLNMCRDIGYDLIHVYEDDWMYKKDIVKSLIRSRLGLADNKIYARNTTVVKMSHAETKQFFTDNHIQGPSRGGLTYCLTYNGCVVAAMQFSVCSSSRGKQKENTYELVRYATSCGVVGGAGKLFAAFLKENPHVVSVVSYSDIGLFSGKMYELLGFVHLHTTPPDYKIVKGRKRYHKANFKKSILAKRYPDVYDDTLTEREICTKLNLHRIYNCGLAKWVWYKPLDNQNKPVLN